MMARSSLVFLGLASTFVVVVSCFTASTTTRTNYNNNLHNGRKQHGLTFPTIPIFSRKEQPVVGISFPRLTTLLMEVKESASNMLDGVVELGETTTTTEDAAKTLASTTSTGSLVEQVVAPFFSQGEIDPETLNPDLSDPKQARVILYIILSLVPVLFLIPLMIGSRDLIPLDAVSPVQL